MKLNLRDLQALLQENGILINFAGRFTQEIIEELGDAVKRYLETENTPQSDTHNVFAVFIEQTQNIKNYGRAKESTPLGERIAASGIVAIGKSEAGYYVSSGNLIDAGDAARLTEALDALAGLDKAQLKKVYKEKLRQEVPPGAQSAGIGLIDMARRAAKPLEYAIASLDETMAFFTLKVYV